MSNYIEIDGFKLNYSISGSGVPAIIIGSPEYYDKTFSIELRKHLQLIFMEHRGFAKIFPENPSQNLFELDTLVDDIEKLRVKLNLDKIILIGHSGHGFIALSYAKKYPCNVSHIIAISTPLDLSQNSMAHAESIWSNLIDHDRKRQFSQDQQEFAMKYQNKEWCSEVFINYMLYNKAKTWYDFKFDAHYLWENVVWNIQIANYLWGTVFRDIDINEIISGVNVPILLTLGLYDFAQAPWFSWEKIQQNYDNVTMKLFSKSGHNPQLEQQIEFDQIVLEWLF